MAAMMVVLAVADGVALAATIDGTRGNDGIMGTDARDQLAAGAAPTCCGVSGAPTP